MSPEPSACLLHGPSGDFYSCPSLSDRASARILEETFIISTSQLDGYASLVTEPLSLVFLALEQEPNKLCGYTDPS